MAGKDFGGLDFSEIFKDLNQLANQVTKSAESVEQSAEEAGERVGESFSNGVERGLEDAASKISASSFKISKAFKDLAKRVTNQSITLNGISIDFSDIDIDSDDFQRRIDEIFEQFKIDNAIEFDSKATEKQFKNILALHAKYKAKLSKLQEQRPRLTSQASIKANAQEQLAIIEGLKEIQRVLEQTSGMSIELPHVHLGDTKELRDSIRLIEQLEKGEEKVGKQRDTNVEKIKKENKELKEQKKILEEKVQLAEKEQTKTQEKPKNKKPALLEHVEILEDSDEMSVAKTGAQKRKVAAEIVKNEYSLYKKLEEARDNGGVTKSGEIFDVDAEALARQKERVEAAIALYEKYGGQVEKLGKKIHAFADEWGMIGQYAVESEHYNIGEEMLKFGAQLKELEKELGDPQRWLGRYTELMDQIRQGALTAADAVEKLRAEVAASPSEEQTRLPEESRLAEEEARIAAEREKQAEARRKELTSELIDPEDYYYDTKTLEEILSKNREILETLKQEGLLTDDLGTKYAMVNEAIEERIAYQKAERAAEKTFGGDLDNLYDKIYATDDPDEANAYLEERKRLLDEISPLVRGDYEATIEAETQTNVLIERRIALLREAQAGRIDVDDIDDILKENGNLETKLERLQEVSEDWGLKIKDDDVDDDQDAIDALEDFEETYDRIILKLANGRKIEILPNAKDLRALYKYYDGIDSGSYGESEIEDVEFVRKEMQQTSREAEQQAEVQVQANDAEIESNKEKIESYEELSNVVSRYIELAKTLVDTEKNTPEHKQIQSDLNSIWTSDLPNDEQGYIDAINKQQTNVSRIKAAIKAGASTYTDADGDVYDIVEDTLAKAESKLRGYIYHYAENFEDIGRLVDGANGKRLKNLIEKEANKFKVDDDIQKQQREIAEAANQAALAEMEQIEEVIMNSAPVESAEKVLRTLSNLKYDANSVDRFTRSSETDRLADQIGITSPHKEIENNAKAIESYEDLCDVVERYNELQRKRFVYTGGEHETLSEEEENEFANLHGRLKATREGVDINPLVGFDGISDIEKLAQLLGIEVPKAADAARQSVDGLNSELRETADGTEKSSPYSAMPRDEATKYISDHYDHDVWDKWYSKSLDPFRTQIAETLENDIEMRNAALNQMWDEYKHLTGEDISFEEFLHKKIPLYRGEPLDSKSESEKALSFSLTPQAAEEFGDRVLEIWMRPIDTLGMANPTYISQPEAEVMVPKDSVPGYDEWRRSLVTRPPEEISSEGVKTETDELATQYQRILSTIREWQTLYQQLQNVSGRDAKELRTNVLSLVQNMSPELVSMIGGQFAENFAQGFKGVKTRDIVTQISRIAGADLLGSVTEQVEMLENINLDDFNFDELPIQETHIDFLKEAFAILKEIDNKKKEMATTDVPAASAGVVDDVVPESAEDSAPKIEAEAKAIDEVGTSAEKASKSKKKFAKANKEVAASTAPSVEGLEAEADAMEDVGEVAEKAGKTISEESRRAAESLSFSTRDFTSLYDEMEAYAEQRKAEGGFDMSKVSVKTDALGKPLMASISYYSKKTNETIVETFKLAEDGTDRLILKTRRVTTGITDYERAVVKAIGKQDQLIAQKNKTISSLSGALDPNANRTLFGTKYEEEVREKIQAIRDEVAKLDQVVDGERVILSEKDFLATKRRIAELTQDARDFINASKKAEYAPTQLESHSVSSGNKYRKDQLTAQIQEWKRAGIYAGELKDKAEELGVAVDEITDHDSLRRYLEGMKEAKALAKLATQEKGTEASKMQELIRLQKRRNDIASELSALDPSNTERRRILISQMHVAQEEYNAALAEATDEQKSQLQILQEEHRAQINLARARSRDAEKRKADAPNLNYGKTTANSARRKFDATEGAVDALGVTNPEVLAKLDIYKEKVLEIERLREKFASDPNAAKDTVMVKQFQRVAYEAENVRRGIKAIIDEEQKMLQMSEEQGFSPVSLTVDQIANLETEMRELAMTNAQGRVEIKGWNDEHTKMYYTVTNSKGVVEEMTVALGQGTNTLYKYRTATKETGTLMQQIFKGIKTKAKELISFVIGGGGVYKVVEMLKKGIQHIREIDLALTELKKVTDETEEAYDEFLKTAAKIGARLGTTISAVTEATATFAKLGYTMEQATEMAESAIVYKNVGDNIASTEDAADSIISTMKGFKLEATESMKIVDRFNEVGNRFAITSQGIGEALRLSASALSEGGNSLDESIGLITAANEVVNDPSSVGKNKLADIKSGYISQNPEVDKT